METLSIETRFCRSCRKSKTTDNFTYGFKSCDMCIDKKKRYRETYREELKDKARERYEENRDDILQKRKEYILNNHDKVLQQKKEYRERNKEQIREKAKENYEANKTKILLNQKCYRNQKIMCPVCGCQIDKYNKQHEQTNKHIRNQEKLNELQNNENLNKKD